MDSDGLAVWTAYAGSTTAGNMACFDFRAGNIVVKNPDTAILVTVWEIARKLGARVQGDDCEVYCSDGTIT